MKPLSAFVSSLSSLLLLLLCFCATNVVVAVNTEDLGETSGPCNPNDKNDKAACGPTDGYVADGILHEDEFVRIWNMTLPPGATTSMHRHDHDYHFVVLQPSDIRIYGEDGQHLFDFYAAGTLGFSVQGDELVPIGATFDHPIPRVHAAQNIGKGTFMEILYERKKSFAKENADAEASCSGNAGEEASV